MTNHEPDTEHRPAEAAPAARPGPFLCAVGEPLPGGWQRTGPAPDSLICLAFDPSRHTVVHSFEGQRDNHLAEVAARAGFERFEVPGSQAGFFALDRTIQCPPHIRSERQGLSR